MKTLKPQIILWTLAVASVALTLNARAETLGLSQLTAPCQQVATVTAHQPTTTETTSKQRTLPRDLMPPLKASELIGMMVKNPQGRSLGVVRDMAFDTRLGRVVYVAVSSGGLFGMGRPWRAVPPSALSFSAEKRKTLILDISPERWAEAPVFHKMRLNELAAEDTRRSIHQYFNQSWPGSEAAKAQVPQNVTSQARAVPISSGRQTGDLATVATTLHVASDILDRAAVTNRQGQNLGRIHDVLLDPGGGKGSLAIIEFGGALKEKDQFTVPIRLFAFMPGYRSVLLDANRRMFTEARPFDAGKWSGATAGALEVCRFQGLAVSSSVQTAQTRSPY
ncbi:MAG: PRC-barrel domain-containing protein [Verrucomicrobia bacterium]|nr:PRC-barrel domain-containing protein [Verrucomicrobiota bacterium]